MDTLTHLTLGACTGEIILGKKLVKKALIWGALAQCLPDIDTAATLFFPADKAFLIHRGLLHSLPVAVITGVLLGLLLKYIYRKQNIPGLVLIFFFCFQLITHDLLDCCNSYGTGLLEPFNHSRFTINLLYVADPLFTLGLLMASILLIIKSRQNPNRAAWAYTAIGISISYICFAGFNKYYINKKVSLSISSQNLPVDSYFTTPTPFNCMLWYIVARKGQGYYTGYSSVFDNKRKQISFEYLPKNSGLIADQHTMLFKNLVDFAGNDYTISNFDGKNYFNILRFEQIQGWSIRNAAFSFSYPLSGKPADASLLQKGRLSGWNSESFKAYLNRIAGD